MSTDGSHLVKCSKHADRYKMLAFLKYVATLPFEMFVLKNRHATQSSELPCKTQLFKTVTNKKMDFDRPPAWTSCLRQLDDLL